MVAGGERSGDSIPYGGSIPYWDAFDSSGEKTEDDDFISDVAEDDYSFSAGAEDDYFSSVEKKNSQPRRALQSLGSAAGSGGNPINITVHEASSLFLLLLVMLCATLLLVRCCEKTRHPNKLKTVSAEDFIV